MLGKRCRQIRRSTSMSAFSEHPAPDRPPPGDGRRAVGSSERGHKIARPPEAHGVDSAAVCVTVDESACLDDAPMLEQPAACCSDRPPTVHESGAFAAPYCTSVAVASSKPLPFLSPQAGYRAYYVGAVPPYFVQGRREAAQAIPPVDFLDACFFCKRRLGHGRDIFIYKGDAAFCSEECRHHQILSDERREKCSVSASKKGTAPPTLNVKTSAKVASSGTAVAA